MSPMKQRETRVVMGRFALAAAALLAAAPAARAQIAAEPPLPKLKSVTPEAQRVHEMITLHGENFGRFEPGDSVVVFASGAVAIKVGAPYVWRDGFIQVRVPVGHRVGPTITPVPKDAGLKVYVVNAVGESNTKKFRVITSDGDLKFVERTKIVEQHDVSDFLGDPEFNLARTKDAEIGDINADGYPDLIDNNSWNVWNETHSVIRFNRAGEQFSALRWEPVGPGEPYRFAVTIPDDGDFGGNLVTYDADFADLDNDELVDWIQAAAQTSPTRLRIAMNNHNGRPGRFLESTSRWLPEPSFGGSPDDIAHVDVNGDGFVDIGVGVRFSPAAAVLLNRGGETFHDPITLSLEAPYGSIHDTFFTDANTDNLWDVFLANESGDAQIYLQDRSVDPPFTAGPVIPFASYTGIPADFNGDGLGDFALGGCAAVSVFVRNPPWAISPYSEVELEDATCLIYDLEAGDVNLDGTVDLIAAAITTDGEQTVRVWLNDGNADFKNVTSPGASALFPGIGDFQRLSADLIDFDVDGDLDLYITGADGIGVEGFGDAPNQFYENKLIE